MNPKTAMREILEKCQDKNVSFEDLGRWVSASAYMLLEKERVTTQSDAVDFAKFLGKNYDCFLDDLKGVIWSHNGHFTTEQLYEKFKKNDKRQITHNHG